MQQFSVVWGKAGASAGAEAPIFSEVCLLFYADLNPKPTSLGKLKVRDFMACMEITGNIEPLRFMAGHFGAAFPP